jgi:hypothetical protein
MRVHDVAGKVLLDKSQGGVRLKMQGFKCVPMPWRAKYCSTRYMVAFQSIHEGSNACG